MKWRVKLLLISGALLLLVTGGYVMKGLITRARFSKQELTKYCYSGGGNMNGNSHSFTIERIDEEHALITTSRADRHDEEPEVHEYTVDRRVLDEIKEVFLAEGMFRWEGRKFTKLLIMDGETRRYSFLFTDDDICFSSQFFSGAYGKKLKKIDEVIEKYYKETEE